MSLCVSAGAAPVALPLAAFLLSWTHSVERVEWREHWRVEANALVLTEARVKGSGAGMEPGEGAFLHDGWWVWRPGLRVSHLALARSQEAGSWRLCAVDGTDCRDLSPDEDDAGPVRLFPCAAPHAESCEDQPMPVRPAGCARGRIGPDP